MGGTSVPGLGKAYPPGKLIGGLFIPFTCAVLCGTTAFFILQILEHHGAALWIQVGLAIAGGVIIYIMTALLFFKKFTQLVIRDVTLILRDRQTVKSDT